MNRKIIEVGDVPASDLLVGAIYRGELTLRNEPISRLMGDGVSNSSGFRKCYRSCAVKTSRGRRSDLRALAFVAIYTSGTDLDWPDHFDDATGVFTYYGDNRKPGHELHDTDKGGNWLLRDIWDGLLSRDLSRGDVPPIFVFRKAGEGHDVEFLGIAVPGARDSRIEESLVAMWRSKDGAPFQNYRADFTVLDASPIDRRWLEELKSGNGADRYAPPAWTHWVRTGQYRPRVTLPVIEHRSRAEQEPQTPQERRLIDRIRSFYKDDPYRFEQFAAALVVMAEPGRIRDIEVTRARRDGGRDAIGNYIVGFGADPVTVEFAVEAKCTSTSLGVKEVARLLSRIRHRQFGVLVTTSYVAEQAYKEIKEDGQPIAIFAATDIAKTLIRCGYGELDRLQALLDSTDGELGFADGYSAVTLPFASGS